MRVLTGNPWVFDTYQILVSGGLDSTALLLWSLENLPPERLVFVHAVTGVGWPETETYLDYLQHKTGVRIHRVRNGDLPYPPKRDGTLRDVLTTGADMLSIVQLRGKWPNPKYRYCTTYLKTWPLRLNAEQYPNCCQVSGIRADESARRAARPEFDPRGNKTGQPHWYPLIDWTRQDCAGMLARHGVHLNPVYRWAPRCGCWCCFMRGNTHAAGHFCRRYPDLAWPLVRLEINLGHTWRDDLSLWAVWTRAQDQMELGLCPA